jgi:hypothetical protein
MLNDTTSASWLEIRDIHLLEPSSKSRFEAQGPTRRVFTLRRTGRLYVVDCT